MALTPESTNGVAELLHLLCKHFRLDKYETVKIAEKVFPGRPWKQLMKEQQEKDLELLREIFGWEEGDEE